jgi:glutathione S-transferase
VPCLCKTSSSKSLSRLTSCRMLFQVLEKTLGDGRQWLCGESFSVADVAVGAYLLYMPQFFPDLNVGAWPAISEYMLRCAQRPAYKKAYEKEQPLVEAKCRAYLDSPPTGGGKKNFGFNIFG